MIPAVSALFLLLVPGQEPTDPAPTDAPVAPVAPAPAAADEAAQVAAAQDALAAGEYRKARGILGRLIVRENLARAEALIADGRALDALVVLDEAMELSPRDASIVHARGAAAMVAAEEAGASNPAFFYADALEHFREALRLGHDVSGWFDASRAARRVPDPEAALALAREGVARLERLEQPPAVEPPPERTLAEASFDVFVARIQNGEDAEEHFVETEDHLAALLGLVPEDPWPREQLANLYGWVRRDGQAAQQLQITLELAPDRQDLHDRLIRIAPATLGFPALRGWYAGFTDLYPGSARAWRNRGVVEFESALADLEAGRGDPAAFAAAEEHLAAARALDEAWTNDCLGWEAVCRNARGWCHYNAGEYTQAKEAFLSTENLFEGGLRWSIPGRLPDAFGGLDLVVQGLIDVDVNDVRSLDRMVEAAAIADYLHAYLPEDGNVANNAGFVNRDTAVLFERKAVLVRSQAAREEDPEARAAKEREAERLMARAQELMQRSEAAYLVAAGALPDNVRVLNDTGLILTYYTREDPDRAERFLLSAVSKGSEQLAADDALPEDHPDKLSPDARFALNEAWGDAHQNLAILELTLRDRPQEARPWLARALDIGPPSREALRPLLDVIDARIAGEDVDLERAVGRMVWLHNPSN